MDRENVLQSNKNSKRVWIIILALVITVVIVGGGIYAWQKSNPSQQFSEETNPEKIKIARESLVDYFNLLNKKQYDKAIKYHGSGYDYLRAWNPSLNRDDYAGLLKNGCEINGLQCLKVKEVLKQEQISPKEFRFVVQFANNDGSLFKREPCCGADEEQMPTKTDFEFIVKLINGKYIVATQPVYVP